MKTIIARIRSYADKATAILTVTAGLSYLFGLIRDRLLARQFGATVDLDIYNAAFIIPDLLLNIFIAGALQAAFIPLLTAIRIKRGSTQADKFASTILNTAILLVLILGSLTALCMPFISPLIAPGITGEDRALLTTTARLLLISTVLFAASNTLGAMLVSKKTYLAYGLSPVLYNIGIIGGILFIAPTIGIMGVVIGTVIGALLHLLMRLIWIWKQQFTYSFVAISAWKTKPFQKLIQLMLPKMVGHPAEQLSFWAFTAIASTLAAGSITMLSFARNFMSVPVSLFGIAVATTIFPILTEDATAKNMSRYRAHLKKSITKVLILTIPSAIALMIGGTFIIRILLGGGKFDEQAVQTTALLLQVLALSIPLESTSHILSRAFYAIQNTFLPVVITIISLLVMIASAWVLSKNIGITGLGWGFLIGSITKNILLAALLKREIPKITADQSQSSLLHPG
jgi:putative peptidoglycan lipid II flippase